MMPRAILYRPDDRGVFVPAGIVETVPPETAEEGAAGVEYVPVSDAAALRELAYESEADVFRDRAASYRQEAEAWRNEGNEERAIAADLKADRALCSYLEKKEAIRARYPDVPGPDAAERYALTSTGTYHRLDCQYAAGGEPLTLGEIAMDNPAARPCAKCSPPPAGEG